ncbi:hypothetical protein EGI32_13510 [Ferruginibacter sp. HRS2-29]|nr:hypothetical protein [Ferruginibacter sp. HRS2-29]
MLSTSGVCASETLRGWRENPGGLLFNLRAFAPLKRSGVEEKTPEVFAFQPPGFVPVKRSGVGGKNPGGLLFNLRAFAPLY